MCICDGVVLGKDGHESRIVSQLQRECGKFINVGAQLLCFQLKRMLNRCAFVAHVDMILGYIIIDKQHGKQHDNHCADRQTQLCADRGLVSPCAKTLIQFHNILALQKAKQYCQPMEMYTAQDMMETG